MFSNIGILVSNIVQDTVTSTFQKYGLIVKTMPLTYLEKKYQNFFFGANFGTLYEVQNGSEF